MELLILSTCSATLIALFTLLRIPLNRWTVPSASIGGIMLVFALIQVLNYYHPYSGTSRQYDSTTTAAGEQLVQAPSIANQRNLVAWFHHASLLRLKNGSAVEVAFDHVPGRVFSGTVETVLTTGDEGHDSAWGRDPDLAMKAQAPMIPVLIKISDPAFETYLMPTPGGLHAQAAVYGDELEQLALVRKTLLRMSAWMNYLSPVS